MKLHGSHSVFSEVRLCCRWWSSLPKAAHGGELLMLRWMHSSPRRLSFEARRTISVLSLRMYEADPRLDHYVRARGSTHHSPLTWRFVQRASSALYEAQFGVVSHRAELSIVRSLLAVDHGMHNRDPSVWSTRCIVQHRNPSENCM